MGWSYNVFKETQRGRWSLASVNHVGGPGKFSATWVSRDYVSVPLRLSVLSIISSKDGTRTASALWCGMCITGSYLWGKKVAVQAVPN